MGDDAADDDEDDDDDMPALEGDDEAAEDTTGDSKGKGTEKLSDTPAAADSKIQEVS